MLHTLNESRDDGDHMSEGHVQFGSCDYENPSDQDPDDDNTWWCQPSLKREGIEQPMDQQRMIAMTKRAELCKRKREPSGDDNNYMHAQPQLFSNMQAILQCHEFPVPPNDTSAEPVN